jgi:uncharacterized protein
LFNSKHEIQPKFGMRPIYIPELLNAPQQTKDLDVQDSIADLETLTPVQGTLRVSHCGNYLQVTAKVETIVTLSCDRCLQQFNHRLVCHTSEMIWLQEPATETLPDELEVGLEELIESLSPVGYFDPQDWLYQQLMLALPQRQLCDAKCAGLITSQPDASPTDSRWAALAALQQGLLDGNPEN